MRIETTSGTHYTAFTGMRRVASGTLADVALAVKRAAEAAPWTPLLVFRDADAERVELDLRGTDAEVLARLGPREGATTPPIDDAPSVNRATAGPGRPKLGVVAREVTLLPRHWEWLNRQPGGASVALRKLVEEARRASASADRIRHAQETAYRFLSALAGNLPDFENVTRALFAEDGTTFNHLTQTWPPDIRDYAHVLATDAFRQKENPKE